MALKYICKKLEAPTVGSTWTKIPVSGPSTGDAPEGFDVTVTSSGSSHVIDMYCPRVTPDGCPETDEPFTVYSGAVSGLVKVRGCTDFRVTVDGNGCSPASGRPYVTIAVSSSSIGYNILMRMTSDEGGIHTDPCSSPGPGLVFDPFYPPGDNPSYWRPGSCEDGYFQFHVLFLTSYCNSDARVTITIEAT